MAVRGWLLWPPGNGYVGRSGIRCANGIMGVAASPHRRDARCLDEGSQLVVGTNAPRMASAAVRGACQDTGHTIDLAAGVPLAREREIRSFLILGSQRSGKTVFLRSLLRQLLGTPSKLVVHDIKGDMTANWPDDRFILLAPQDSRSWAWDIAGDVTNELDAFELAATLVPEGRESNWAQGAQLILTGLIVSLQHSHGPEWGWRELLEIMEQSPTAMRDAVGKFLPTAAYLLNVDENGKFTPNAASYANSLFAPLTRLLRPLAQAWGDIHPENRLLADRLA